MEFQVPQFIEQKPKIVGFLTLYQFFYVAGAALVAYISFRIFNILLAVLVTLIAAALGIAFAFVKINGQEFPKTIAAIFGYLWGPKIYTWQRQALQESIKLDEIENLRNKMSLQEKLKSITLSIATGKFFKPTAGGEKEERFETVVFLTGERGRAKRVDY